MSYANVIEMLREHYVNQGRHDLPWRKKQTPYYVAVSEIMLQQTQVSRVVPYFRNWMKQFPSWRALARATQTDVLRAWKGLGYNSRALRLHKLAKIVSTQLAGRLPRDRTRLESLPGIGPYTAGAIRAFVWNEHELFVETNIRTVIMHHFFPRINDKISDQAIQVKLEKLLDIWLETNTVTSTEASKRRELFRCLGTREFYAAMMDYGSYLKCLGVQINHRAKAYTKQSTFKGSDRQLRGKIIGLLLEQTYSLTQLAQDTDEPSQRVQMIVDDLVKEGFVARDGDRILLA